MSNIIRAVFEQNSYTATATRADGKPIWQWNYGQILQLHGLDLPKAVEVHFSHSNIGGDALIRIGTTTDKITEVAIPESFLEHSGKVTAYVYCSTVDHGQTEYKTYFRVEARAKPEAWDKPEDAELFHETIEVVNEAADRAETAAGNAAASAEAAHTDAGKTAADRTVVEQCKTQAIQAAENALLSENAAGLSQEAAQVAQGQAELYARQTQDDAAKTAADRVATGQDREAVAADKVVANEASERAESAEGNIAGMLSGAEATITELLDATTQGNTTTSDLNTAIKTAETSNGNLTDTVTAADTKKQELDGSITTANTALGSLTQQNTTAASNIAALQSENYDANEILTGVDDIKAYIGYTDEDIVGLQVDYENKSFQRLAGAYGLSAGTDFDKYEMYGGRKRCTVADDGTITSWYGDTDYVEDGTMGQVMVYQPKFWYKVVPLKIEPITDGIGHHLRKANYYVSTKPKTGFKLHPAFGANGGEVDYILYSAYEGSVYDTSANTYLLADEQVADFTAGTGDKFCSIAGAKPASGKTQNLTRPNIEQLAQNRGAGWHGDAIKAESADQLLMIIELGMMNTQTGIGQGVVSIPDTPNTDNNSIATGGTSALGNVTGQAPGTSGQSSVSYRGVENPWGNIWKLVNGVNTYGDGNMKGGVPYICSDFAFVESKNDDNYESAGFTISNANGCVSAMGYSKTYDWLFIPSETLGNSAVPVGDYIYITPNLNAYRIALLGGSWKSSSGAGGFCWSLATGVGGSSQGLCGRLVFIPTKDSVAYTAAITSWKAQMAA